MGRQSDIPKRTRKRNGLQRIWSAVEWLIAAVRTKRCQLNQNMKQHYSAGKMATVSASVCMAVGILILFVPPYLGIANDGIGNRKMTESGFTYLERGKNETDASNDYFTRVYERTTPQGEGISSHLFFINLAKALDLFFTQDNLFDIRFLALLYLILWIPGVYLVIRAALERISYFSEAAVLSVLGILVFSDISCVAYLNSLYSDALIWICLLYIAGSALLLHKEGKRDKILVLVFTVAGIVLTIAERRCFLAGVFLSVFLILQIRIFSQMSMKMLSFLCSVILFALALAGFYNCKDEFDQTAKFHSMTRGVLLQSADPEKELERMNIDHSYTVLTDCSLYDYYPVTEIGNPLIQKGFLDRYDGGDVALFYLRNPGAMISMWDLGVKAAFDLRRSYCGNYEKSVGMPAMGKSIFWSAWSIFKERSAPKTIGYVLILTIAFSVMSGKKVFHKKDIRRWDYVYFCVMSMLVLLCMGDLTYVILKSGDAQFVQYNIVSGTVMDLLFYYVLAEMLHKLNILEARNEKNE